MLTGSDDNINDGQTQENLMQSLDFHSAARRAFLGGFLMVCLPSFGLLDLTPFVSGENVFEEVEKFDVSALVQCWKPKENVNANSKQLKKGQVFYKIISGRMCVVLWEGDTREVAEKDGKEEVGEYLPSRGFSGVILCEPGFHKMTPWSPHTHLGGPMAAVRDHNSTRRPSKREREKKKAKMEQEREKERTQHTHTTHPHNTHTTGSAIQGEWLCGHCNLCQVAVSAVQVFKGVR